MGVLGLFFILGFQITASLMAESKSIECRVLLTRAGGILDVQVQMDPAFDSEPIRYSGVVVRKSSQGLIRVNVRGTAWPGSFGYEIQEKMTLGSDTPSNRLSGAVLLIPYANYPKSELIPFSLEEGAFFEIPVRLSLSPEKESYFQFAFNYLGHAVGGKENWGMINVEWNRFFPQSDREKFLSATGPVLESHLTPRFVEEVSREVFIKNYLENNSNAWDEVVSKLSAKEFRIFRVIEADGSMAYYLSIWHELSRHIIQVRILESKS